MFKINDKIRLISDYSGICTVPSDSSGTIENTIPGDTHCCIAFNDEFITSEIIRCYSMTTLWIPKEMLASHNNVVSKKEDSIEENPHCGMIQNPIDGSWSWGF